MKKILNPGIAVLLLALTVFAGCEKTEPVILPPANTKPVANAGNDARIRLPNTVILDGSASTDVEHNIVSYKWVLGSGPSTATIANPNSVKTQVKFLDKGTYRFDLIVTDSGGRASGDFVNVVVLDTQFLNIKALNDTTIRLPFDRLALMVDGQDINDLDLNWKKISGPNSFYIPDPNSKWTNVYRLTEGIYQFEINATNSMQTTVKDTVTVTVLPDNNTYSSEKLFENLAWVDDYPYSSITIANTSSIIPPAIPFKVYLKTDLNADWQIVISELQYVFDPLNSLYMYYYSINNNAIRVYLNYDPTGFGNDSFGNFYQNPAIKIVY